MTWGYVAVAAATVIGGAMSSDASRKASHTQADAANQAAGNATDEFNILNEQNQPWVQAGQKAVGQLGDLTAAGSPFMHQFNASDLQSNLAPNYQFMLDQGLGATKNAANLQTGLVSGNALKGINDYAQNYASNAYQNAFNNYNTSQANIFNRLASIAGLGQTSSNIVGNQGVALTGMANNYLTGGAAAQAAGQVGQANAISGGLSSLGNTALLNSLINSNNNQTNTSTTTQPASGGGGGLFGSIGGLFGGGGGGAPAAGGSSGFMSGSFSGGSF